MSMTDAWSRLGEEERRWRNNREASPTLDKIRQNITKCPTPLVSQRWAIDAPCCERLTYFKLTGRPREGILKLGYLTSEESKSIREYVAELANDFPTTLVLTWFDGEGKMTTRDKFENVRFLPEIHIEGHAGRTEAIVVELSFAFS